MNFGGRILKCGAHGVLLVFLLTGGRALADTRVLQPTLNVDPARGECIAPPAEMRRNHMSMLRHQRDRTVRLGERGTKVTLNGCINCHAGKTSGSVIGSRTEFCESCHAFTAVKLDCFECHQPKASPTTTKVTSGLQP